MRSRGEPAASKRAPVAGVAAAGHELSLPRAAAACYRAGMRKASRKITTARARRWRVSIILSKSTYFGTVEAPDQSAAETIAAEQFGRD